jgi:hypothetical protein
MVASLDFSLKLIWYRSLRLKFKLISLGEHPMKGSSFDWAKIHFSYRQQSG